MIMPTNTVQNSRSFASLIECLQEIRDPRMAKKVRYPLVPIILMALCASLGGANNWVEIAVFCKDHRNWFQEYLQINCGVPSHDTFNRVFNLVHAKNLVDWLVVWMENNFEKDINTDVIDIDGKVLEAYSSENPLILVRAWSQQFNCAIGMVKVERGSNEITAIPPLLDSLYIKGKIITIDAIGAQKEIVKKITDQGGDYLISLKGNQRQLHSDVSLYMNDMFQGYFTEKRSYAESVEVSRGRIETRRCFTTDNLDWLEERKKWKNLNSIVAIETTIQSIKTGKASRNIRYFITSLPPNATRLLRIARSHWSIENKLHWPLDRYFDEDRSTTRDFYGAQNFSFLRTIAIAILQRVQKINPGRSIATLRQTVNRRPDFITSILLNWE